MSRLLQRQTENESSAHRPSNDRPVAESTTFRLARLLFGAVFAFLATDNLRNLEGRTQYAESKNVPIPSLSVPAASGGLLFGGIGLALWRVPAASAAAVVGFFAAVTPLMHDFWNLEDPEQRQQEFIQFAKNTALLGAALAFLRLGRSKRSET